MRWAVRAGQREPAAEAAVSLASLVSQLLLPDGDRGVLPVIRSRDSLLGAALAGGS